MRTHAYCARLNTFSKLSSILLSQRQSLISQVARSNYIRYSLHTYITIPAPSRNHRKYELSCLLPQPALRTFTVQHTFTTHVSQYTYQHTSTSRPGELHLLNFRSARHRGCIMAPIPITSGASLSPSLAKRIPSLFLFKRQQTQSNTPELIPTTYGNLNSGPPPGTVVGIVLGSVGGFLLLLWLFYTCFNVGRPSEDDSVVEEVVVRDKRKRHSKGKVFSSA